MFVKSKRTQTFWHLEKLVSRFQVASRVNILNNMAKRRTKKQKQKAKHDFAISWEPKAKKRRSEPDVKGQIKKSGSGKKPSGTGNDLAKNTAEPGNLASIKKDIIKSLILAGLILASEVVIYLTWL